MRLRVLFILMALTIAPMAFAGTYTLSDWCFYVNSLDLNQSCNSGGGLANVPTADPGVTDLIHLQNDGTSTLTVTLAPGHYNVFGILNYNVDGNGSNEYASAPKTAAPTAPPIDRNNEIMEVTAPSRARPATV